MSGFLLSVAPSQSGRGASTLAAVLLAVVPSSSCPAEPEPWMTSVKVDGRAVLLGDTIAIPTTARETRFEFAAANVRLRHRLEGVDATWRDERVTTRVLVRFHDDNRRVVGVEEVELSGESRGWNGSVETSPFHGYSSVMTVPPRACAATVSFLTAGGDGLIGVIGVDAVEMTVEPIGGGDVQRHRLFPLKGLGETPDILDTPQDWQRAGSSAEISQIRIRQVSSPHPILALVDGDTSAFGNWELITPVTIVPGDVVTLSWQAAHTLGAGGSSFATYGPLPQGNSWFRVAAFRPNGEPLNAETSLAITVVLPWYRRRDVWLTALAIGAAGAAFGGRYLALRRLKRRIEEVERANQVERERTRIARDLHDEIGAVLTEIAMQAAWVRRDVQGYASDETLECADSICHSAVDLVRSVDAIVWAVNPAHDTLDRFAAYLIQSTQHFLGASGMSIRFDVPGRLPPLPLDGAVRHRLFLVVREAINNTYKHARATLVRLSLRLEGERLVIMVEDDGCGFEPAAVALVTDCDGLQNMRHRMEEVGGTFQLVSQPGRGTRTTVSLPMDRQPVARDSGATGE